MNNDRPLPPAPDYVRAVYSRATLVKALSAIDKICTVAVALIYAVLMAVLLRWDPVYCLLTLTVSGVPFVLVLLMRRVVDRPRPYEVYDLLGCDVVRHKQGRSFPSMHVFSAAVIGTSLCFFAPAFGAIVLVLGVCLGACRILLAIHHPSDVIVGGIIGAVSGVVGMIIVNLT